MAGVMLPILRYIVGGKGGLLNWFVKSPWKTVELIKHVSYFVLSILYISFSILYCERWVQGFVESTYIVQYMQIVLFRFNNTTFDVIISLVDFLFCRGICLMSMCCFWLPDWHTHFIFGWSIGRDGASSSHATTIWSSSGDVECSAYFCWISRWYAYGYMVAGRWAILAQHRDFPAKQCSWWQILISGQWLKVATVLVSPPLVAEYRLSLFCKVGAEIVLRVDCEVTSLLYCIVSVPI